jgi:integrase
MRGDQIDQDENVWIYSPSGHKTEHLGKDRVIYLGPAAQEILKPYMRKGILFPSVGRGRNSSYRGTMTVSGYRKAIRVACQAVGVSVWKPNQLRHTALTEIRREHGLEAAQVIAGHSSADTTEIYAERDSALAKRIAFLRKP